MEGEDFAFLGSETVTTTSTTPGSTATLFGVGRSIGAEYLVTRHLGVQLGLGVRFLQAEVAPPATGGTGTPPRNPTAAQLVTSATAGVVLHL